MAMDKLKPCPFCAGKAHLFHPCQTEGGDCFGAHVECSECLASSPVRTTEEAAIEAWNTRAYQDESTFLTEVKSLIACLEREADSAEVAYVHYGDAEDRAEHCAYKDAARRLREVVDGRNNA